MVSFTKDKRNATTENNEEKGRIGLNKRVSMGDRGNGKIEIAFRIDGDGQSTIETGVATVL